MDPEQSKVLVALITAVAGVGGAAVGAWFNQRGARKIAERSLQGQRIMARDDAEREWLSSAARKLLDGFTERQLKYKALVDIVLSEDVKKLPEARTLIRDLEATKEILAFTATHGLDDPGVSKAFAGYADAESQQLRVAWRLIKEGEEGMPGPLLQQSAGELDDCAQAAGRAVSELRRVLVSLMFAAPR